MRFLFYFIHPAKYHAFRVTINTLLKKGHTVDIAIISKDMIEDLVKNEEWRYTNIFPEGRRIPHLHTYLSATINAFRTLFRLWRLVRGKKYDLVITDDLMTIIARLKGVPSIFFTDDDLSAVPESVLLIATAKYVMCPNVAYMGYFTYKKIGYNGLKSLAHLHPNVFSSDLEHLPSDLQEMAGKYFFIRCVSVTSTHDVSKRGINNSLLTLLVRCLEPYGKVIISTQRELPMELNKHVYPFNKSMISHYIAFSKIFISDSTTMCAEACVLGTPAIEIDDWFSDFEQYKILHDKYELLDGFYPDEKEKIIARISELISDGNLKKNCVLKRNRFLEDHIDLSAFMIWMFENYPESINKYFINPAIQNGFK